MRRTISKSSKKKLAGRHTAGEDEQTCAADLQWQDHLRAAYETIDGYALARTEKKRQRDDGVFLDGIQYGEIDFVSFATALAWCNPVAGERFIDLGSGTGKATLTAAANHAFSSAAGVEILPPLHEAAQQAFERCNKSVLLCPNITFHCADALTFPWTSANVIFVSTTCWTEEMCAKLASDASSLQSGARLLCTSRELESSDLRLLRRGALPYGRGMLTFLAYERI